MLLRSVVVSLGLSELALKLLTCRCPVLFVLGQRSLSSFRLDLELRNLRLELVVLIANVTKSPHGLAMLRQLVLVVLLSASCYLCLRGYQQRLGLHLCLEVGSIVLDAGDLGFQGILLLGETHRLLLMLAAKLSQLSIGSRKLRRDLFNTLLKV